MIILSGGVVFFIFVVLPLIIYFIIHFSVYGSKTKTLPKHVYKYAKPIFLEVDAWKII